MNNWRVDEDKVLAVPEPKFTRTWHPVSHGKIIDVMGNAVKESGLGVVDKTYTLSKDLGNMFGSWVLDAGQAGMRWMVGFRNSVTKAFGVGMCSGNHVTVCENMIFSGEFLEFHKHTMRMSQGYLQEMAGRAMVKLTSEMKGLETWHSGLKELRMCQSDFKILAYDAMDKEVFPPSRFRNFIECMDE